MHAYELFPSKYFINVSLENLTLVANEKNLAQSTDKFKCV